MSIYYRENGILKKWNINANDIQVLDVDGKYSSHNLEDVLKEVGSGTETNMTRIEGLVDDLGNKLSDATNVIPSVAYGMNNKIINDGTVSVQPKFTITGKDYINRLGKDGNCEDVTKWNIYQTTGTLDTINKVFGSNGIKVTLTSTVGTFYRNFGAIADVTKYYLISAYIKNGNATNVSIEKDPTTGGVMKTSSLITDTTKFTRVGIVVQPSDLNSANNIAVRVNGASGQYAYVDGFMVNEITSAEYALGASALLDKYPYVDSYSCLQNPYIEVRHDNMIRNGNGEEGTAWWITNLIGNLSLTYDNNYFVLTDSDSSNINTMIQDIPVKVGTTYNIMATLKRGTSDVRLWCNLIDSNKIVVQAYAVDQMVTSTSDTIVNASFTVPSGVSYVRVAIAVGNTTTNTGTCYAKNIMVIEGTTAPTSYKPCRIERCVLETKLTSDDSIVYDNGEVSGKIWWKHKAINGKDYGWQFQTDYTGYKSVYANIVNPGGISAIDKHEIIVKYDGKIIVNGADGATFTGGDMANFEAPSGNLYCGISDGDAGWTDTLNPNGDEIKAYFNGWYCTNNYNSRYCAWYAKGKDNLTDVNAYPPRTATTLTVATTGTTSITVSDASIFAVGDSVAIYGNGRTTITAINGNILTVADAQNAQPIGRICFRLDNGTTDLRILSYVKNNLAPNCNGGELHYKLAMPEVITNTNVHIHGDIPKFDIGENYLFLDNGIVLGEVVYPQYSSSYPGNYYFNNITDNILMASIFKNKTEFIYAIYKNEKYDNKTVIRIPPVGCGNGVYDAYVTTGDYDGSAIYTSDYKIIATSAPQIGSISCSYSKDIINSITKLEEGINNRQVHDVILDQMIDTSIYERVYVFGLTPWSFQGSVFNEVHIPYKPKKGKPKFRILQQPVFWCYGAGNVKTYQLYWVKIFATEIVLCYQFQDANEINAIRTNNSLGTNGMLVEVYCD